MDSGSSGNFSLVLARPSIQVVLTALVAVSYLCLYTLEILCGLENSSPPLDTGKQAQACQIQKISSQQAQACQI